MSELINPTDILFHLINLVILVVAARFLVFKPVAKFMDKRRTGFEKEREDINNKQTELDDFNKNKNKLLQEAKQEAENYRQEQRKIADEHAKGIIDKANLQAKEDSVKKLEEVSHQMEEELKNQQQEVVKSAVSMAESILKKELSQTDETSLVEQFIRESKESEDNE